VVIRVVGNISGNSTTVTSLNGEITNDFSIWMFTISFLFFKFDFERGVSDVVSSGNDSVSTVMCLALGVNDWYIWESRFEVNWNEIFHNIFDGTDGKLVSTR
jgi:hypothetical protein